MMSLIVLGEETENSIKSMYIDGAPVSDIKRRFSIHDRVINRIVSKAGISLRPPRNKHHSVNSLVFDSLTPEAMYWLGFIFADGTIGSSDNLVRLEIGISDINHVAKFAAFLKTSCPVRTSWNQGSKLPGFRASVSVRSEHLHRRLKELGMRKKIDGRIATKECAASPDFWRGIIDGDGWVGLWPDHGKPTARIGACGCRELMEQFLEFAKGVLPNTKARVYDRTNICIAQFDCRQARTLISAIYRRTGPALDRKVISAFEAIQDHPHYRKAV